MSETMSQDTEPDIATWQHWPHAPSGDFARLIPLSQITQRAFRRVVWRIENDPSFPASSREYIHYEAAAPEAQTTDTEPSEGEGQEQRQSDATNEPNVTGFYRLNMSSIAPANPGIGWILGTGGRQYKVDFILCEGQQFGVRHRHARLKRSPSGLILAISDQRELWVDGKRFKREIKLVGQDAGDYQQILKNGSTLMLGDLRYTVQYRAVDREHDLQQFQDAMARIGEKPPIDFLLTPTPTTEVTTVGAYDLTAPVGVGTYSTVYYGTRHDNGHVYAIKKMIAKTSREQAAIQNEIGILTFCKHPNIYSIVDTFTRMETNSLLRPLKEIYLVLEPAFRRTLDLFVSGTGKSAAHTIPSLRPALVKSLLVQLGSACAYLHDEGIMHRDIKPTNIGIRGEAAPFTFYLIDFGHATREVASRDHMKGTVRYLAPEVQALKAEVAEQPYTNAVDVWALGVVGLELWELRVIQSTEDARKKIRELLRLLGRDEVAKMLGKMVVDSADERCTMAEVAEAAEALSH